MTIRLPGQLPSSSSKSPPCTMKWPPNGARVASIRSRYSTIGGPIMTRRIWATAYADMFPPGFLRWRLGTATTIGGRDRARNYRGGHAGVLAPGEPRVALGVLGRVVRIQVDEAPLDQPVADLEHVAPPARRPFRHPGPPRAVPVPAVAGALAHHHVARDHPVEMGVVVDNRGERGAHVAEHLADGLLAVGQAPLGEVDLRVLGEQVQDAAASRGDAAVVERLQVLQRDGLALFVSHRLNGQGHRATTVLGRNSWVDIQHISEARAESALRRSARKVPDARAAGHGAAGLR